MMRPSLNLLNSNCARIISPYTVPPMRIFVSPSSGSIDCILCFQRHSALRGPSLLPFAVVPLLQSSLQLNGNGYDDVNSDDDVFLHGSLSFMTQARWSVFVAPFITRSFLPLTDPFLCTCGVSVRPFHYKFSSYLLVLVRERAQMVNPLVGPFVRKNLLWMNLPVFIKRLFTVLTVSIM